MTANKMPVLPEAIYERRGEWPDDKAQPLYTADQMRAMYLAGIAAARGCVPEIAKRSTSPVGEQLGECTVAQGAAVLTVNAPCANGWNLCVKTILANLSALEQGVGK